MRWRLAPACIAALVATSLSIGCATRPPSPDIARLYNQAAQNIGSMRNPVIVVPGILGSKLEHPGTETPVWGAFVYGAADADTPEGARLVALPMERGVPLRELRDDVVPTDVLDTLTLDVGLLRGLEIRAYVDILRTLAAGDYRDESLGEAGAIDYGGLHYTCFQQAYDWRRDISEQAALLHQRVLDAISVAQENGIEREKVDVVAHSMGGLVLRYYLRYGPVPLPDDGSLPTLTWAGAEYVDHAILIGTPSGGSPLSLRQLVEGVQFAALLTPTYRPAILGTMPAIYQLLPRPRHGRVVDAESGEALDVLDPAVWEAYEWGLADPDQDRVLRQLLPDVPSEAERRAIALDHLAKCLARAEQLFAALDVPASPPEGTSIFLVAGDAHETPDVLGARKGADRLEVLSTAPGDNTVARWSALLDERTGAPYVPRLRSPIGWEGVQFLTSDHIGLTKDPVFVNWILYTLLERPRVEPEENVE